MPWPMWPREMIFKSTGIFDRANKACLSVCKTVSSGKQWFGYEVPNVSDGHVDIIINRGYHFF